MKENMKDENVIDVRKIIAKIWHKRKLFAKVLPVVFLVSCWLLKQRILFRAEC